MIETGEIFYIKNPGFRYNLNQNNNLIGFNNGVYDLNNFEFRDGRPNDNISFTTGYDYNPNYSENKDMLLKFLSDIQPNKDELDYLLTFLSLCISSQTPEELLHIFQGTSRNGKSALRDLLIATLGNYYDTIDSTVLTTKKTTSSGPSPELANLHGKRVVVASEPQGDSKINSGFMKLLTGNDPIPFRGMYKETVETFVPQFKLILLCNDIPVMDKNDQGVWSRCRCINFPSRFVDDPKKPHEKKIDRNLKHKISEWKNDFMLILIEYYKKYLETGLKPTKTIMTVTDEYKKDSDIFAEYIDDRLCESDTHIFMKDLYENFEEWFINNYNSKKIPSRKEILAGIKKYYDVKRTIRIKDITSSGIEKVSFKIIIDDKKI